MKVAAFLGKFSIFYAICATKNSDELSVNIDHVYCIVNRKSKFVLVIH